MKFSTRFGRRFEHPNHVAKGKIKRIWQALDLLGIMRQLKE